MESPMMVWDQPRPTVVGIQGINQGMAMLLLSLPFKRQKKKGSGEQVGGWREVRGDSPVEKLKVKLFKSHFQLQLPLLHIFSCRVSGSSANPSILKYFLFPLSSSLSLTGFVL